MALILKGKAKSAIAAAKPSPNTMTNLVLADIALRAGGALLRRGMEKGVLGQSIGKQKASSVVRGRGLAQTLIGTAIARIATRSVPGAIVIGGGLLAKTLYDRRHAKTAKARGETALAKQAKRGEKD